MNKNGSLWFATGIVVGAAVGLLYAPRSGVRTRAAAAAKAERAQEFLKRQGAQMSRTARQAASQGAEAARDATGRINRVLDASRKVIWG